MKHLLIILASMLLLTACEKDSDIEDTDYRLPARRTVLVFMAGENNLSGYAQSDLNEMIQGRKSVGADCDMLVFIDKAAEKPFIARIRNKADQPVDTLYKYTEDYYFCDRFEEILQRMVSYSPQARDYGLIFWGHANGWILENNGKDVIRRAYGVDNGDNTSTVRVKEPSRWLNIPDMAKVIKQQSLPIKYLFFDCCNMQCAEVAYELRQTADYIIASPAEITGIGAPYQTLVKDFFIEDDEQLGKQLCIDYHAQITHEMGLGDEQLPISVVRTSKMQALADATRNIMPMIAAHLQTGNPTKDIIYYYNYDANNFFPEYGKVLYDMNDMIRTALGDDAEAYTTWKKAFDDAVCYSEGSARWHSTTLKFRDIDFQVTPEKQGCLSMFFPLKKYQQSQHNYNEEIKKLQWYQAVGLSEVE